MKTNKNYFLHQLKTNSRPLIVVAICVLILGFYICIDNMDRVQTLHYNDQVQEYVIVNKAHPNGYYVGEFGGLIDCKTPSRTIEYRDLTLVYPVALLVVLCHIVPVWMFSFMKKRRNLDCCYSLPISKRALGMTNYLVGLVLVFVPFLLSYIQNLMMYATHSLEMFKNLQISALIYHFLICILMGLILYTLFSFVFNEANTVLDGCIFIIAYSIAGFFILMSFNGIVNESLVRNEEGGIPWAYFGSLLSDYEMTIERGITSHVADAWNEENAKFWFVIWILAGIFAFFAFVFVLNNKKAENTEDISTSAFGYKTLIPFLSIPAAISACEFGNINQGGDAISGIFITLAAVIAYTVYRRGVKYKPSDYVVMGILLFFTVTAAIK